MSPKWILAIGFIWLAFAFLCSIFEGGYVGEGETSKLSILLDAPVFTGQGNIAINFFMTLMDANMWTALGGILFFQFSMFDGAWRIFQVLLILLPVSIVVSIAIGIIGARTS